MRLSALAILNTALEVGGTSLGRWPELREGVRDEGCRHLFQVGLLYLSRPQRTIQLMLFSLAPAYPFRLARTTRAITSHHLDPFFNTIPSSEAPTRALSILRH